MFRFENPNALNFLILIPVLVGLFVLVFRHRQAKLAAVFSDRIRDFLTASVDQRRRKWRFALWMSALLLMAIALARPQWGQSRQKMKSEGIELVILFDVSRSMLAEDVRPSRLEFAKKEVSRLIEATAGDRIGLIAFAGSAVLMSPVTNDKSALIMFVESLSVESVGSQGTHFQAAMDEAEAAFERGGVEDTETTSVTRAVVVVSDGEDNEPGAEEAAKKLAQKGVKIFSLVVGTEAGGKIPLRNDRGMLTGYARDRRGTEILTRTNGDALRALADKGGGGFYPLAFGSDGIENFLADIKKLESAEFDSTENMLFDEYYQPILFLAVVLFWWALLINERRTRGREWRGRFEKLV
jgi:Ca-activated chloride channel family protein